MVRFNESPVHSLKQIHSSARFAVYPKGRILLKCAKTTDILVRISTEYLSLIVSSGDWCLVELMILGGDPGKEIYASYFKPLAIYTS